MTKINITLETLINTGDFNNIKLSYGLEEEPKPGETVKQAFDRVRSFLEDQLMADAAAVSTEWAGVREKRYGKRSNSN